VNIPLYSVLRYAMLASGVVLLSCSRHAGNSHVVSEIEAPTMVYASEDGIVVQHGNSIVRRHKWSGSDLRSCPAFSRWVLWMEDDKIVWLDIYSGTTGVLVRLDDVAGLPVSKRFDTWAISPNGESVALAKLPLEVWIVDLSKRSARRVLHEDKMREATPARPSEEAVPLVVYLAPRGDNVAFSYSSGSYLYWAAGDFAPATYVYDPALGTLTRLGEGKPVGWLDAEHILVMRTWVGSRQQQSLLVYDAEGRVVGSLDDVAAAATDAVGRVVVVRSQRDKHGDYSGGVQRLAEVEVWTSDLTSLTTRLRLGAPFHPGDAFRVLAPDDAK